MRKPNFFIVGAPKCGTSSAYYSLLQHPDIFMPHLPGVSTFVQEPWAHDHRTIHSATLLKEPHFFGSDLHFALTERAATQVDEYLRLFQGATDERRVGEASVWYLYSKVAAAEIKRFEPDARIIIMVRDPVEVMFRLHGQACLIGAETITDFEAALEAEPGRRETPGPLPSDVVLRELVFYRRGVAFAEQIQRYFDQFGREQTRVVVFDDLKEDSARIYREIFAFLEVDDDFRPSTPRVNPMSEIRSMRLQRFMMHPPQGLRSAVRRMIPLSVRKLVVSKVVRSNVKYGTRPQLDLAVRRRLQAELAGEVQRLGDLLGRDLSHWSRD